MRALRTATLLRSQANDKLVHGNFRLRRLDVTESVGKDSYRRREVTGTI